MAKNGILMLDRVEHLRAEGMSLKEALVQSGRRRLRPVFMTSLAAALGMLPLAYGIGSGADMLRPLAIAVMGVLAISELLALVATPAAHSLLTRVFVGTGPEVIALTPAAQPRVPEPEALPHGPSATHYSLTGSTELVAAAGPPPRPIQAGRSPQR
ncbi:MAG: efflux RND transporter permease subunit [Gemmataceae bacterium]